jgi:hypothetical protein
MADHPATTEPKRRWYQFRLRTVLVGVVLLSIPLAYVGRQAKQVAQRKAMLKWIVDRGGTIFHLNNETKPPMLLRLLGEDGYCIGLPEDLSPEERAQIAELFPDEYEWYDWAQRPY